jgi:GST-like protein
LARLDAGGVRGFALAQRFALLAMHADNGAIATLCGRLRVPEECRELALLAAHHHAVVGKALTASAADLVALLQATDALRRPDRFAQLLEVCAVDAADSTVDAAVERLRAASGAARGVDAGAIAQRCKAPREIKERVAKARVAAVSCLLRTDAVPEQKHTAKKGEAMLDLYTWTTPNGRKVSIMLEEVGLPYRVHAINIGQNDQFKPEFVAISPNSKIPALVDADGPDGKPYAMMESGAILVYLAGKTGMLLPAADRRKYDALQWLMFQMGGVGPMFGQVHHFLRAAKEPVPYAIERYTKEKDRLYGVLDRRLADHEYVADEYSIADIATYPWVARYEWHKTNLADFPHVKRWFDAISVRPAVQRGMRVPVI